MFDPIVQTRRSKMIYHDKSDLTAWLAGEESIERVYCIDDDVLWYAFHCGVFYLHFSNRWVGWTDDEKEDLQSRFILQLGEAMTCSNELGRIAIALEGMLLQAKIANTKQCCTAYGGVPVDEADPGEPETETPPPGFEDWASFQEYKCKAANRIADNWIDTVRNMSNLGGLTGIIGAAAIGLFLETSLLSGILVGVMALGFSAGTAAALIIAALVALVLGGIGQFAFFDDLADDLTDNKEDFVCQLFQSVNVASAKTVVQEFTAGYAVLDEPFHSTVVSIIDAIFNADLLNLLFEEDAETAAYEGDINCDDCTEPPPENALFWTNYEQPYNEVLYGFWTPQWDQTPDTGDIYEASDGGWCSQTIRGAGTYRLIKFYFPNPNYGQPVTTNWRIRIEFTLQNVASQSWLMWCGSTLTQSGIVRGPGYSSNAFRASTGGTTPLDTYVEFTVPLDKDIDHCYISSLFYYDSNYNNSLPGCMRKFLVTGYEV